MTQVEPPVKVIDPEGPPDGLILESLGVALMVVDPACRVTRFNSRAEQLTHVAHDQILGRPCHELLQAGTCPKACPLREALATGTTGRVGMVVLQPRGQPAATIEMTASAFFGPEEELLGAVAIFGQVAEQVVPARFYGSRIFSSSTSQMRRIFESLPRIASSDAPLLIVGPRGAGRSALAETVHGLRRKDRPRPWAQLNCAQLQRGPTLSRALGPDFAGRLRGGTLLLEEIATAPVPLQKELLAWIEETEERVGVRLISTATEALHGQVERGLFRRDLFHRLNVLHVVLPGLDQRRMDIPLLAEQFIQDLNQTRSRPVDGLTPEALRALLEMDYPGNVRQLRQILERAHARCRGPRIRATDLELATGA